MYRLFRGMLAAFAAGSCFFMISPRLSAQPTPDEIRQIREAIPARPVIQPAKPRKLLVFARAEGYKHASIAYAAKMLQLMGEKTGAFEAVVSDKMAAFEKSNLEQFDAVCFANTTKLAFENPKYRKNLLDFAGKRGKGIIGIHAATDNFYTWPAAAAMLGGLFDGHPWKASGTWAIKIDDPDHPLTTAFSGKGFKVNDELYRIVKPYTRENLRVLLSLDLNDAATLMAKGSRPADIDLPVSWIRQYGKGRVFYCSLGHNPHIYWTPAIVRYYLDGIQYALGDYPVDATPSVAKSLQVLQKYQYGQSRTALTELATFIRYSIDSAEALARLEKEFIRLLESRETTLAARQFICERLSEIGTAASVPALSRLLPTPETADMARYALERLPGEAAGAALRKALGKTGGKAKIGMINSLAVRRDTRATRAITRLIDAADAQVSAAAVSALGALATPEAVAALEAKLPAASPALRSQIWDALLRCADQLLAENETARALAVYRKLAAQRVPAPVQFAALRGEVKAAPQQAGERLVQVLQGKDAQRRAAAVMLVSELNDPSVLASIAAILPGLPETDQTQLLIALAGKQHPALLRVMEQAAATTSHPALRVAALRALGQSGTAATVPLLARVAAEAPRGESREAARQSLYRLRGEQVDREIVRALPGAPPPVRVEYLRSVAARRITSATDLCLQAAGNADQPVRLAAVRALREIAAPDAVPALVDLLLAAQSESDRREQQRTLIAAANRSPRRTARGKAILARLPAAKDTPSRASLLEILGNVGDPEALPVLRSSLRDRDPAIRTAALRALSAWPDPAPEADLLALAKTSSNAVYRALAFRGYIRLLGLDTTRTAAAKVPLYRQAMDFAPGDNEKKLVLSGLAKVKALPALEMALAYMGRPALRAEAAVAIVQMAEGMPPTDMHVLKAALQQALPVVTDESLVRKGKKQLALIDRVEDHITLWEVAGPYTQADVDLFDFAFAPEKNSAAVEWKTVPAGTDPKRSWVVDLANLLGGSNRVAYLRTRVWSPEDGPARLEIGSDDGVKAWLNGKLVHANNATRGLRAGDDIVPVQLKKGWNTVLLKIRQGGGDWGGCARFRAPDGTRLDGLEFSLHP